MFDKLFQLISFQPLELNVTEFYKFVPKEVVPVRPANNNAYCLHNDQFTLIISTLTISGFKKKNEYALKIKIYVKKNASFREKERQSYQSAIKTHLEPQEGTQL